MAGTSPAMTISESAAVIAEHLTQRPFGIDGAADVVDQPAAAFQDHVVADQLARRRLRDRAGFFGDAHQHRRSFGILPFDRCIESTHQRVLRIGDRIEAGRALIAFRRQPVGLAPELRGARGKILAPGLVIFPDEVAVVGVVALAVIACDDALVDRGDGRVGAFRREGGKGGKEKEEEGGDEVAAGEQGGAPEGYEAAAWTDEFATNWKLIFRRCFVPQRVSLLAHARGRRPDPHEPEQPVRAPRRDQANVGI
jgi:hypothetical protein